MVLFLKHTEKQIVMCFWKEKDLIRNNHDDLKFCALRKHAYSNILKILPPKNENFQLKKKLILFIFLLKT